MRILPLALPWNRGEDAHRIAEVGKLFNKAGLIVITAFISPDHDDREADKRIIGERCFLEVFLDAPPAVCEGTAAERALSQGSGGRSRRVYGYSGALRAARIS
jgi:adenylylsulfate kinase